MKSLNEIAQRNDYVKSTKALRNAVKEIAGIVCSKMIELDFDERNEGINVNGTWYEIRKKKANSGYSENYLYCGSGSLEVENSFYYSGDFNCWVERADNSDFVKFANDLQDILKVLDETESELSQKANPDSFWGFYNSWKEVEEKQTQSN